MAPDGSFLVFGSNRPKSPGGKALDAVLADGSVRTGKGNNLWRVDRKGEGWGEPVRLPDSVNNSGRIFSASVVGDGSVYFQRPDPTSQTFHLFVPRIERQLSGADARCDHPAAADEEIRQ